MSPGNQIKYNKVVVSVGSAISYDNLTTFTFTFNETGYYEIIFGADWDQVIPPPPPPQPNAIVLKENSTELDESRLFVNSAGAWATMSYILNVTTVSTTLQVVNSTHSGSNITLIDPFTTTILPTTTSAFVSIKKID